MTEQPARPIALDAYETLAEAYSSLAEKKAENGFIEHPAIRKQVGSVQDCTVLEAGCGPGIMAHYLLNNGAAEVVGIDVSPAMINLATSRTTGRAKFHIADMSFPMPFLQSDYFDLVTSSLAIDYVKDWSIPLGEFHRVLKPGGRFVFSVQHPMGAYKWYKPESAFGVHYAESTWTGFTSTPVVVPDYYRSFDEIVNPLVSAGFNIKKLVETKPVPELKKRNPAKFERCSVFPTFMVIEAVAAD